MRENTTVIRVTKPVKAKCDTGLLKYQQSTKNPYAPMSDLIDLLISEHLKSES